MRVGDRATIGLASSRVGGKLAVGGSSEAADHGVVVGQAASAEITWSAYSLVTSSSSTKAERI